MIPPGRVAQPPPSNCICEPSSVAVFTNVPFQLGPPTESAKFVLPAGSLKLYRWVSVSDRLVVAEKSTSAAADANVSTGICLFIGGGRPRTSSTLNQGPRPATHDS